MQSSVLTDVLALIERLGDVPSEDGVHGAHQDEQDRVSERYHIGGVDVGVAHQQVVLPCWVVVDGAGRGDHHPNSVDYHL